MAVSIGPMLVWLQMQHVIKHRSFISTRLQPSGSGFQTISTASMADDIEDMLMRRSSPCDLWNLLACRYSLDVVLPLSKRFVSGQPDDKLTIGIALQKWETT